MKTNSLFFLFFLAMASIYLVSCGDEDPPVVDPCDSINASYEGDVKAIISGCANSNCHGGTNMDIPEVSRDFTTYAGLNAVTTSGILVKRVITDKTMPPSGALSQANLDILQCWADAGYPQN